MRRRLVLVSAVCALLAVLGTFAPPAGGGDAAVNQITITKVVDGDGPTGGYVIELSCNSFESPDTFEVLTFDQAGPGNPESQTFDFDVIDQICTVVETEDNGADTVTYACTAVVEPLEGSPATEGSADPGCIDDQRLQMRDYASTYGEITVTNTFEPEVIDEEEEPPVVDDDDVVTATPPFTG